MILWHVILWIEREPMNWLHEWRCVYLHQTLVMSNGRALFFSFIRILFGFVLVLLSILWNLHIWILFVFFSLPCSMSECLFVWLTARMCPVSVYIESVYILFGQKPLLLGIKNLMRTRFTFFCFVSFALEFRFVSFCSIAFLYSY